MSEPLLKAIIELFAFVAKEDDITLSERQTIEEFLLEQLNRNKAIKYIKEFDKVSKDLLSRNIDSDSEDELIHSICGRINNELTYKQKVVLMQQLVELILADGFISKREDELVRNIGEHFKISQQEIDIIQFFIQGQTPEKLASPHILIINEEKNPGYPLHYYVTGLHGFLAVLYLQSADFYIIKYNGKANVYLNGIALKNNNITPLSSGSTIRSHKIDPIYYSDIVNRINQKRFDENISFKAENIFFKFKNGKIGLRDINIAEESGKMIGLMGASGAGKSTLLNVLNSTEKPSEGSVKINGIDIHNEKEKIEGVIGYVPQDDLLIEDLTVYQNLYFASKLCFDNLSEEELDALVNKTLDSLGLLEISDLKVGSPLEKTISGGQRKRLNIGLELLREPSVLFVDEPTSGLSSRDSENIMDLLKELSLKGKLVFIVIHQPSSDIFKMFDKMVILDVGGYQIFYGNPIEAVTYFKEIFHLINSEEGECVECGNVNPEQIFNIIETKVVDEFGNLTNERKVSPEQWNEYFRERIKIPKIEDVESKPKKSLKLPNRLSQIKIFSTRDVLSKLSNKQYLVINLLEAPVLALLLAYIVKYSGGESVYYFSENVNLPSYIFMSIIVSLFMGLTVSAEEIIRDRKILKREAFLNLSRSSYLASKISILFTISALQTLAFVLVGNSILEIQGMFWNYWIVLFSTSCFANLLGLNISAAFNSVITIYILIPILLIPQLILSGVVVSFDNLNASISSKDKVPLVGELMASRWAFEAVMVHQYKDNRFEKEFYALDREMSNSEYKKVYYIPELLSILEYCHNNYDKKEDPRIQEKLKENFSILRNEINKELTLVGEDKLTEVDKLSVDSYNEEIYSKTKSFLETLRKFYSIKFNKASDKKDELISSKINDDEKHEQFEETRKLYQNERIAQIVKNVAQPQRIVKNDNELVQKIYPIYWKPSPDRHPLNFRTQFYAPEKPFLGKLYDTFGFNVVIIWVMTIGLGITLYFDLLRKFVEAFERH